MPSRVTAAPPAAAAPLSRYRTRIDQHPPPSRPLAPLLPDTAHTAPPWPHSRERRTCDAATSVRAHSRPPMAPPQLALAPIRDHASASRQITCTNTSPSQSCPMRSRPRTSPTATCRVGDGLSICMPLHYADASSRHNGQHPAHGCCMCHALCVCVARLIPTSRSSPGTSTASPSKNWLRALTWLLLKQNDRLVCYLLCVAQSVH